MGAPANIGTCKAELDRTWPRGRDALRSDGGRRMDVQQRLDVLLDLAKELEIDVRSEPLGGDGGGLCVLRGKRVLFVDLSADTETRYEKSLAALADVPEMAERFLAPEIREDLERYGAARNP
jgi:hypothetical protein